MPDLDDLAGWDWTTIDDLKGTPEGQRIECKRKTVPTTPVLENADVDKLACAVSGFANSSGGIYLLGVDAKPERKGMADTIGGAVPIADLQRCLANVKTQLTTLTDPPVRIPEVRAIEKPGTGGRGIIAIRVEASEVGPHRVARGAEAGRYYMRTDDSTVLMPHSVLALLFGKTPQPKLVLLATYDGAMINLRLRNDGRGTARQVTIILDEPPHSSGARTAGNCNEQDGFRILYGPRSNRGSRVGYASDRLVLYPGYDVDAYVFNGLHNVGKPVRLRGCLYAADAAPRPFDHVLTVRAEPHELPVENPVYAPDPIAALDMLEPSAVVPKNE